MSERKVLNKYYPPDFDPSKIPRLRLPKDRQYTVRLMAPCNMRCTTCGEYIYKGKKFNARKETVQNEEYLTLKIYRFYIKCPRCLAEITFKTDPQNADYVVEHGATRNFQALKLAEEAAEREAKEKEEEEKNNPMKLLENRTKASKQEMEALEALEEIRDLNQRHAKVDFEKLLMQNHMKLVEEQKRQEAEDEAFIRETFLTADGEKIKRIHEEEDLEAKIEVIKKEVRNGAATSLLCDDASSGDSLAKRPKFVDSEPKTSRQKNIEMLRKAVKVKKNPSTSDGKTSSGSSQPQAMSERTLTTTNVSVKSKSVDNSNNDKKCAAEQKPSALSLLSNYSESDSDS